MLAYSIQIKFGSSGWVDVTSAAGNIVINRGTSRVMEDYSAGSIQITFTNNDRIFDPLNTSSPLWYSAGGYSLVQPGGQVLVTTGIYDRFYGWISNWDFNFDEAGLNGNATLNAGDLLYFMGRINFDASQEALGKFTGDRIQDVLTSKGLDISHIGSNNVVTLVGADTHNSGDNVLSYLQNVARSEPADFFAASNGSINPYLVLKDRTFTYYSWSTSYRQNLVEYPYSGSTVWTSTYSASTATPYYPGTAINSKVDSPNNFHAVSYHEINSATYNPSGTASSYVFSCWVRGNGGTVGIDATVSLLDAQNNNITYPIVSPLVSGTAANNTTWINLKGTVTSSGAQPVAGASFLISCGGTTNSYSFIADGFQFEDASTYDGSYFSGAYNPKTNATKTRYEVSWFGQAYASKSIMGINTAALIPSNPSYLNFADANSQGTAYGNGTAIPFMDLQLVYSGDNLYTQTQVVGVNGTGSATDSVGTGLYGLRSYSQTDNLTPSLTRPAKIAKDLLAYWRLPEYRASSFTVALESLTDAQKNKILSLDLRDVIRVCFQPSATGSVVDKYYQILAIDTNIDIERDHITFMIASLSNLPLRLDAPIVGKLNTSILG
jgi:hypothetical protein